VTRRETSTDIDQAAAAWVARADRGRLTDAEQAELGAWLTGDLRRQGAFARANAVMARVDLASRSRLDTAYAMRAATSRRRLLIGGSLAAAFGGASVLGVRSWSAPLVLQSSKGEVRRVPLPDGSSVTLNTQSRVEVRYTAHARAVALTGGEALFNVAEDGRRPFVVRAGEVSLRGGRASFSVRRDARGPVRVMVQAGKVEMTCQGASAPLLLAANAAVSAPVDGAAPTAAPVRLDADEVARRLAWQDGLLAFNGESLAQAAAEFARYSSTRIVIDDPALAAEPLTGLYASSDPEGFARAVAISFGGRTVVDAGVVRISR
jgi:transmembrane sensor